MDIHGDPGWVAIHFYNIMFLLVLSQICISLDPELGWYWGSSWIAGYIYAHITASLMAWYWASSYFAAFSFDGMSNLVAFVAIAVAIFILNSAGVFLGSQF